MRHLIIPFLVLFLSGKGLDAARALSKISVFDKQTEQPLIGANIVLLTASERTATVSDLNGFFTIPKVSPGKTYDDKSVIWDLIPLTPPQHSGHQRQGSRA